MSPPFSDIGALLFALGAVSTLWATFAFSKAGTPIIPLEQSTALVTHGLYRITRNPMCLGPVVALIGIALLLGTVPPFFVIPIFVWVIRRRFVLREERFLEEIFGKQYVAYKPASDDGCDNVF